MKKVIGIMPLWDDAKESIWMLPGYLDGVRQAGGLPIIFPLTGDISEIRQLCRMCDGFVLTGGHDVCPELYGEEPLQGLVVSCRQRDDMERVVFQYAVEENKPLLGICRGIQFINAALGGTLYQDLPLEHSSQINHHMEAPYDRVCHTVRVKKDSPLFALLQTEELGVNSYHHQAIKQLAPSLQSMARSEDGLIEAVYMPEKDFVWALQWHPEFSCQTDRNSQKIWEYFVSRCG